MVSGLGPCTEISHLTAEAIVARNVSLSGCRIRERPSA